MCRAIESHHRVIARKVRDGVAPVQLPASQPAAQHHNRTAVPVDVDPDPISVHLDVDTIAHDITPVHGRRTATKISQPAIAISWTRCAIPPQRLRCR